MPMNTNSPVASLQATNKLGKRSLWKRTLLGLASIVAMLVGYRYWSSYQYEKQLLGLIAQIEADDPDWNWDRQQVRRNALKEKDNAAIEIVELLKLTTLRESIGIANRNEWGKAFYQLYYTDVFVWYEQFLEMHPNATLPEPMRAKIQPLMEMAPMPAVMDRARKLRNYQSGRFEHNMKPLLMMSLLPDVQGTRSVGNLLAWDSDLNASRGQLPQTIESIQGMLGIARSFSHDPFLVSQLIRMALVNHAGKQTMRLLAMPVSWSPAQLLTLQEEFEQEHELSQDILEKMIKGDRATLDHDLQMLIDAKVTYYEIAKMYGRRIAWQTGITRIDEVMTDVFPELVLGWGNRPGNLLKERYDLLNFYTLAVHWSRLPDHQLLTAVEVWNSTGPFLTPFLRQYFMYAGMFGVGSDPIPEVKKMHSLAKAFLNNRAKVRSIAALLACERYRLDKGAWPASWEAMTPQYLKQAPKDPFNGQHLLLKTLKDGLVIYAVGENGQDNGGEVLLPEGGIQATDVGFRLWNVNARGVYMDEKCAEFVKRKKSE